MARTHRPLTRSSLGVTRLAINSSFSQSPPVILSEIAFFFVFPLREIQNLRPQHQFRRLLAHGGEVKAILYPPHPANTSVCPLQVHRGCHRTPIQIGLAWDPAATCL